MTTGTGDAGSSSTSDATSEATEGTPGSPGPRGFTPEVATVIGGAAGFAVLIPVTYAAGLLLDNTYGPLGESESAGGYAALGCAAVAALAVFTVVRWVALRTSTWCLVLLVVSAAVAWVLLPRQIDVSESWVPRPNERYACTGWTFRHYPPGTMDGSSTTYCIGFRHRIADG
jgi:hypothetical protein